MQNNSKNYGQWGEELAASHLIKQGYRILARNWRFKKLEIDIVAKKNETIVIIEVKSRKNGTFGEPEIFVTKRKQQFLIRAAHHFVLEHGLDAEVRFDIIAVTGTDLKHLVGAFYPQAF